MKYFAVDLGATSGRTIISSVEEGKITQEEISRFPNELIEANGHFFWDIYALYNEIIKGLRKAHEAGHEITSIGIDTWGVDFAVVGEDGQIIGMPYAYRDPHTLNAMESYFRKVPKQRVYELTGIQFMNFNSLFQLQAMEDSNSSFLKAAKKILFMPDALSYMLTGQMVCEQTIASTSQILNPRTHELDEELLSPLGLSRNNFGKMVLPGETVGNLLPSVQRQTGYGPVPVIAVAGHDTASAVAAVPAEDRNFAYLSSGTWSLMGIETDNAIINDRSYEINITNEGGIDSTTRFLKNICGMWLLERCRKEWKDGNDYASLIEGAKSSEPFRSIINPDSPCFQNPPSMVEAIKRYCEVTGQKVPETNAEMTRCIFDSLALRYRQVFAYLQDAAPFGIRRLHIIGGGSRNGMLNQCTANAIGIEVVAGPSECTALGNIMIQARASKMAGDRWEMRKLIASASDLKLYEPMDKELWDKGYERYLSVFRNDI